MLLLDAAAIVDLLLRNENGRSVAAAIRGHSLVSVAHLDAEMLGALARLHRDGTLDVDAVQVRLDLLADLELHRLPIIGSLLTSAWNMRENVAVRDALYVAAARAIGAGLLTTDERLARAVGEITVDLEAAPDPPA